MLGACTGDDATRAESQQAVAGERFQRAPQIGPLASKFVPRSVDQTPITVVAMLEGPSVADLQEAQARKLTRAEKDTVKAQRRIEQAGPRASIEAAGGKVVGSFQAALNGIKVRIPRNQVDSLRNIPGVVDVKRVVNYTHENFVGAQRIQAPFAWSGVAGFRGEGIKIAIIDTGVDYTHANFGGPGTVAAFDAAFATSTQPADPALFGPDAPKVKGGIDLVGDDYDANNPETDIPVPDANPLDCNGHGSHVAGSAAGFGVLNTGATFRGSYDQLTHANNAFSIGPGVAPLAEIFAVRVFGCVGSTNVVTEALEWAVDNDMDVVNMSLGSAFGTVDDDSAVASDNAVRAGVVVVASAGNDGDVRYITGSPASSTKTISVAASETPAFIRTATLALPEVTGAAARTVTALNANAANFTSGTTLTAFVLRTGNQVSLGCNPAEYEGKDVAGKVVIVQRGVCARVAKAIFGQKAGAAAVVMINNVNALPPLEGQITFNPDDGQPFLVTIPFFGVRGPAVTATSDGAALALRDGAPIVITEGDAVKTGTAGFSSRGARVGDALLKPDIAAPGVQIVSTQVGSGAGSLTISGTSMASPHVAGAAALVVQAHPRWQPAAVKSAIVNSGIPEELGDYSTSRVGSGMINAAAAAGTLAYAFADRDTTTLNFGLEEFRGDLRERRLVRVRNDGSSTAVFDVSVERQQGSPHTVTPNVRRLLVPARSERSILVTLEVPAATAGNSDAFREVAGLISFTAVGGSNRGIGLRVPYYLVPRVSSNVSTNLPTLRGATPTANATVSNRFSAIPATAEFYALGLESPNARLGSVDLRAAGVQSFDVPADKLVVFAVNTFNAWSTASTQEFDVLIDSNADRIPDFALVGIDIGQVTTGGIDGRIGALLVDLNTGAQSLDFLAVAPTDASTILLPVLASSIGITTDNPRFAYTVQSFDGLGPNTDSFVAQAGFNAFTSAVSNGQFVEVPANESVSVPVSVDRTEFALTPAAGLMVVTPDNRNGAGEADLVRIRF